MADTGAQAARFGRASSPRRAQLPWSVLVGRTVLGALLSAGLTFATVTAAQAEPVGAPSAGEVAAAKQRADDKAVEVARIRGQLVAADAAARTAHDNAESAAEDYNQAQAELEMAKAATAKAKKAADAATVDVGKRRDLAGRFAAASYQGNSELSSVSSLFSATGPQSLLEAAATRTMVDTTLSNAYDSYRAGLAMAKVSKDQADQAEAAQAKATKTLESAYNRAKSAAAKAEATAVAVAKRKGDLVAELARLDGISVALASQRQKALEAERRRIAEAAARKKAEEARLAAEAAQKRAEAAHRRAEVERLRKAEEQRRRTEEQRRRDEEQRQRDQDNQPDPVPQQRDDPEPLPPIGNIPSGGDVTAAQVEHAISYAEDQLGEPYVMGGAGPSVWDCSGLVLKAFGSVGIDYFHGARMQYWTSKPIGFGEIKRGDLLFWSTAHGPPGTIHHVAIYLGDGMLINAPHTGDVVRIVSIGYMGIPDYFARPQNS
jgi:cell wall-associated NlpC family hydrolase